MTNYKESKIWLKLERECKEKKELVNIEKLCDDAIELMKTVRDTFSTYTLHDERHISNVIFLMEQLLGSNGIKKLSIGECTMLLLIACYHDIGMCYTKEQKEREINSKRFDSYLEENPRDFVGVKKSKESQRKIPEDIQQKYFRRIHHLRINELLPEDWEVESARRDYVIEICESHGKDIEDVVAQLSYDKFRETDCILCAILLRLADILDFDSSRTPDILYTFQKISEASDLMADVEWKKHKSSKGFKFLEREKSLVFDAVCESMQEEYEITSFLDYIDSELDKAASILEKYGQEKWKLLWIPKKIEKNIERRGYQAGEYCLSLQADNVLQLLVGDDLYSLDSTFIRELLQNSFDAVRARKMLDYSWNMDGQISVSDWIDNEGFQWFRIDDNGIGMTEQMIMNYFLKVGNSYYQSDEFKKSSYENKHHYIFHPISQFGIGILSCFLVGDRMEVSTRHYNSGKAIRFTMNGIKGYYSIAVEEKGDKGTPMPCRNVKDCDIYRQNTGTSIAIRIKEYLSESVVTYLKRYVCFPDVQVYYKNDFETMKLPTQQDLLQYASKIQNIEIPFSEQIINAMRDKLPETVWEEKPCFSVKCKSLYELMKLPDINGIDFIMSIKGKRAELWPIHIDQFEIRRTLVDTISITKNRIDINFYYQVSCYNSDIWCQISLEKMWQEYSTKNEFTKLCADMITNGDDLKRIDYTDPESREIVDKLIYISELIKVDETRFSESIPFSTNTELELLLDNIILPRCEKGGAFVDNHIIEKSYDGIRFEVAKENDVYDDESYFRYAVLLLSGEFQPRLGVSRENIKYYPIKAASYIELLGTMINHTELSCYFPSYYGEMEFGQFIDLINEPNIYACLEKQLDVRYDVKIKDIKEKISLCEEYELVRVFNFGDIFGVGYYQERFHFLGILLRAFLQKEYEIGWKMNENNAREYFITGLRKTEITEAEKALLPMTFVKSIDGDNEILTEEYVMGRSTLNANHPFSIWLVKNAKALIKKYNRLWKKIRVDICKLDSIRLITAVNHFLDEIERRENISIPESVRLKDRDFM